MLALKIALRYLFSKKSHGVVNIISVISVVGVAVATMAITIVLSIFNGFTQLAYSHLSLLDPEIMVVPASGKTIADGDSLAEVLSGLPEVRQAVPVVSERGLITFAHMQMPVYFKGVPPAYNTFSGIDSVMVAGEYSESHYGVDMAQISAGVAVKTGARVGLDNVISLYVPQRIGRINPANPTGSFRGNDLAVSGIFQVGQSEYDADHIFIPIDIARQLLQYTTESTSVDLSLEPGVTESDALRAISSAVGFDYKVLTRLQQQEEAFRMIEIEKWLTFMMLAFILVIASFNIISTLSLLVIEKRDNMQTLRALGATTSLVRKVFIIQGWLISVCGGVLGIILGALMSVAQQHYGFVKLSGDPGHLTVTAYPVHVQPTDLLIVLALVVVVGLVISQVTRFFKIK